MHRDTCMVIVTQLSPAHRCSCHNSQHNSTIQFVQLKAVFKIPRIPIGIWLVRLKSLACATGRKRYVTPWDIAQTERRQRSRRSTKASAIPYNSQSFDTNCSQLHQKAVLSCLYVHFTNAGLVFIRNDSRMLQHRSSCKPQIEGCSGRRATVAHARRRRNKATAILASKELQDRSKGNDQSGVLCTAQKSTPERQKSRRHFRGVFALRVKFVDNNYVRVNPLLCVIVHVFIDPFSFHSLLSLKRRLPTLHISRVFSVQATNRLVTLLFCMHVVSWAQPMNHSSPCKHTLVCRHLSMRWAHLCI